ncbi:transposase-like protein [Haloarcula quadrata]|uniref:Transposase n=2 Tax=Haloarcula TaxID=2237 RepID=Q5UXD4_HALMA|nr:MULTISPECIES: IS6-like element ISH14 family transposase [Haloarcula]AAV48069.1 transposase [Haloarcula marismortui ATCC 43049]QCP92737.1 IS6-like element ISH14 family transposase [Haloarcula marismortui ATCC 43049]RKS82397.1 transposase-like protein [Haloarcula quadrata]
MAEITRLSGCRDWIDLGFVERERTPEPAMALGIQSHVAGLSLSNTVELLEDLGVQRSRKAVHDWVQKADLQPDSGKSPNQIALDETVIRINDQQFWLYAAADPQSNELLHIRLFATTTTTLTEIFLRELRQKHDVETAVFLVDGAQHLQTALQRAGLRFQMSRHGNRNAVERIFRELKRRTSSFSNCFSHVEPETAENWLLSFARWHNATN